MNCEICNSPFRPGKYNPNQKYCSPECRAIGRKLYKRAYDKAWRRRYPDYMKRYGREYRRL